MVVSRNEEAAQDLHALLPFQWSLGDVFQLRLKLSSWFYDTKGRNLHTKVSKTLYRLRQASAERMFKVWRASTGH